MVDPTIFLELTRHTSWGLQAITTHFEMARGPTHLPVDGSAIVRLKSKVSNLIFKSFKPELSVAGPVRQVSQLSGSPEATATCFIGISSFG